MEVALLFTTARPSGGPVGTGQERMEDVTIYVYILYRRDDRSGVAMRHSFCNYLVDRGKHVGQTTALNATANAKPKHIE